MQLLIKKLVRDYINIYIYVYFIGLIMRIMAEIFSDIEVLQAINGIWIMVSSVLLVAVSTYFLYEFLYTRHKYFYYTLKYSRLNLLLITAIIFTVFNFIYYLVYADLDLWSSIQKLASLTVYFITTSSLLYGYRGLTSKKLGSNLFLFTLVTYLIVHSLTFYKIFSEQIENKFMIGVSSATASRNIYNNIVPITVFVENTIYSKLSSYSFHVNILLLVFFSLSFLILRKRRINW